MRTGVRNSSPCKLLWLFSHLFYHKGFVIQPRSCFKIEVCKNCLEKFRKFWRNFEYFRTQSSLAFGCNSNITIANRPDLQAIYTFLPFGACIFRRIRIFLNLCILPASIKMCEKRWEDRAYQITNRGAQGATVPTPEKDASSGGTCFCSQTGICGVFIAVVYTNLLARYVFFS